MSRVGFASFFSLFLSGTSLILFGAFKSSNLDPELVLYTTIIQLVYIEVYSWSLALVSNVSLEGSDYLLDGLLLLCRQAWVVLDIDPLGPTVEPRSSHLRENTRLDAGVQNGGLRIPCS